jgi:hypothetical protein
MAIPISDLERKLRRMKSADDAFDLLLELHDFFSKNADVKDGPDGPEPDTFMQFAQQITEVLETAGVM